MRRLALVLALAAKAVAAQPMTREAVAHAIAASNADHPADLSGRDLSGLDLTGLNFSRVKLQNATLVGTKFTRDTMFAADLSGAHAHDAPFDGAVLDVGVFRGTDLTQASFRGASVYAVIMIGADLSGADLTDARLIGTLVDSKLVGAKLVDLKGGADMRNQPMGLMRTDLTGADLSGADLTGANLQHARLVRTNLTNATLTHADVTNADVNSAIFHRARGWDSIIGWNKALNTDQAILDH